MNEDLDHFTDIEILAKTIWGEARGEKELGREAVAAVIMNRVKTPNRWDKTVRGVCLAKKQFSCWNSENPNRPKMVAVTIDDPVYDNCLSIAANAVADNLVDPTHEANHYKVVGTRADWAIGQLPVCVIGRHEFYRL